MTEQGMSRSQIRAVAFQGAELGRWKEKQEWWRKWDGWSREEKKKVVADLAKDEFVGCKLIEGTLGAFFLVQFKFP
jgi:hypothetical protein